MNRLNEMCYHGPAFLVAKDPYVMHKIRSAIRCGQWWRYFAKYREDVIKSVTGCDTIPMIILPPRDKYPEVKVMVIELGNKTAEGEE
jgi:hypothetical protein